MTLKHFLLILCSSSMLLLETVMVYGQQSATSAISITFNKTSSLVFPAAITSVDRGSRDVLAQKARGVENILQLKASRQNFPETNLTVITADGMIHQFAVRYSKVPTSLIIHMEDKLKSQDATGPPVIFTASLTATEMDRYARQIVEGKPTVSFKSQRRHRMVIALRSIYAKDNVLFYHFRVTNGSVIPYDVDYFRFYIEDKAKLKRTASQQVGLHPIYVHGNDRSFAGKSTTDLVYAMEKFTVPDAKRLRIEIMEKNGGRNLRLAVNNKCIIKARPLR